MRLNRRRALALGLALAACAPKPPPNPALMVEALYAPFLSHDAPHASLDTAPWTDDMQRLIVQMKAESARRNEPIIDFEPLIDGQDFQITELAVAAASPPADGRCTVAAKFKNFGQAREVDFDLVQVGATWRIADMRTASWDLKTLLQQGLQG